MRMLNKIKSFISVIGIKPNQEINTFKPNTIQEDQRDTVAKKNTIKQIEQSWDAISARAMRPHGFDCTDNLLCEKENCWQWQPDKIVSDPYVVGGPEATKFKLDDYVHKENRTVKQIMHGRKAPKKICENGCENKQYGKCYKCVME